MFTQLGVLRTKLIPPLPKRQVIIPESLERKIKYIPDYQVTLLQSGPGYGKSTAFVHLIQDVKQQVAWYAVAEQDTALFPFVVHLVASLRYADPEFGDGLLEYLRRGPQIGEEGQTD